MSQVFYSCTLIRKSLNLRICWRYLFSVNKVMNKVFSFLLRSGHHWNNYAFSSFFQIASLLDQLEQYKENLISKNEEILQLNLQLEMQEKLSTSSISQLQSENAHLKVGFFSCSVRQLKLQSLLSWVLWSSSCGVINRHLVCFSCQGNTALLLQG